MLRTVGVLNFILVSWVWGELSNQLHRGTTQILHKKTIEAGGDQRSIYQPHGLRFIVCTRQYLNGIYIIKFRPFTVPEG